MTFDEARQFANEHEGGEEVDPERLEEVFTALAGRPPDGEEQKALWWHISELLQD
jgi:hypothetical protein